MAKKNILFQKNPFLDIFKSVFVGVFGAVSAYMVIAFYSITFVSIGLFIIDKYNKPNTKLMVELQTGQYVGIVFCILGLLPYMQYFFAGFLIEGGQHAFNSLFE